MDGVDLTPEDLLPPHSDLGASGMERWSHCPGSFGLSQRERHRAATIHAATGTVAHTLVETVLSTALAGRDPIPDLKRSEGLVIQCEGHDVTITETLTDGVQVMLTYLLKRSRELGVEPLIERTVFVDDYFPPGAPPPVRMFGRADSQFRAPGVLEIVDYKNGSGVTVSVTDNPQLLYYAAGALAAMKVENLEPPNLVMLTVVQPNVRTGEKTCSYYLSALDVLMWVQEVMVPAVRACEKPDAAYVPGGWCRFCPVTHACPELLKDAQMAAKLQFDDSAEVETIKDRLEIAERAVLWAEAMRGFALERMNDGLSVPGWGVVPTRPTRRWTDAGSVGTMLFAAGIEANETKLKSPAKIEKAVGKTTTLWRLLEPYIESKSSGRKLSRVGNDRDDDDNDTGLFDLIDA